MVNIHFCNDDTCNFYRDGICSALTVIHTPTQVSPNKTYVVCETYKAKKEGEGDELHT